MDNPMIPTKKSEKKKAEVKATPKPSVKENADPQKLQQESKAVTDEMEEYYLSLLRRAWDFGHPVEIQNMLIPDEKTVCTGITCGSIAAGCDLFTDDQLKQLKKDLLEDLKEVNKHMQAYMVVRTIIAIIKQQDDQAGKKMLYKILDALGLEFCVEYAD